MSETIKAVFVNYIACAIFGGLLEYVAPQKMQKTLRVIVVSVMLIAAISPVLKADFEFPEMIAGEDIVESNSYTALMHTANLTEKKIYNELRRILINAGIDEYEIYINTTVEQEENTVYLDGVRVEIHKDFADRTEEIKNAVPEEYKAVTVIEVSE